MKISISEQDLKAATTSALKRQHVLGGFPGAQKVLALGVLAVGDAVVRRTGQDNQFEALLGGQDVEQQNAFLMQPPVVSTEELKTSTTTATSIRTKDVAWSTLLDTCLNCNHQKPRVMRCKTEIGWMLPNLKVGYSEQESSIARRSGSE